MSKFFIVGLPRSRTYWLSQFLGCAHEAILNYPDYSEFMESEHIGDSTTAYPWMKEHTYGCKIIVIERDLEEAYQSAMKIMPNVTREPLHQIQAELDSITDCLRIPYNEVSKRLREIWGYCRNEPFDEVRAKRLDKTKLENFDLIKHVKDMLDAENA